MWWWGVGTTAAVALGMGLVCGKKKDKSGSRAAEPAAAEEPAIPLTGRSAAPSAAPLSALPSYVSEGPGQSSAAAPGQPSAPASAGPPVSSS